MPACVLAVALGCGDGGAPVEVGGIDPSVVTMVVQRDGVDEATARHEVEDTMRLVAAAKAANARTQGEPPPLLEPDREAHLRRAAQARLWLETDFEPTHGPQDIPADDPLLARARASQANIHPTVHLVCQLVAVPEGEDLSTDEIVARAKPDAWRRAAHAMFDAVAQRMTRYVPTGDPDACDIMIKILIKHEQVAGDVRLRVEQGAFDLHACSERGPDGSCSKTRFAPEWVAEIRKATPPGFLPPFQTRFGLHLAYVREILPERRADDPETEAYLRELVHPRWQVEAFEAYLDRLQKAKSVKVAASPGAAP